MLQTIRKEELETIEPDGQLRGLKERKESLKDLGISSFGDLVSSTEFL